MFVFPGRNGEHRKEHKKAWAALRKAAHISKDARVHDLRHTYASLLVSSGETLPIIGRLLGHARKTETTKGTLTCRPTRCRRQPTGWRDHHGQAQERQCRADEAGAAMKADRKSKQRLRSVSSHKSLRDLTVALAGNRR